VKVLLPEDLAAVGATTVLQLLAAAVQVGGCVLRLPYCSGLSCCSAPCPDSTGRMP
jgi:hypothetical protein